MSTAVEAFGLTLLTLAIGIVGVAVVVIMATGTILILNQILEFVGEVVFVVVGVFVLIYALLWFSINARKDEEGGGRNEASSRGA